MPQQKRAHVKQLGQAATGHICNKSNNIFSSLNKQSVAKRPSHFTCVVDQVRPKTGSCKDRVQILYTVDPQILD